MFSQLRGVVLHAAGVDFLQRRTNEVMPAQSAWRAQLLIERLSKEQMLESVRHDRVWGQLLLQKRRPARLFQLRDNVVLCQRHYPNQEMQAKLASNHSRDAQNLVGSGAQT